MESGDIILVDLDAFIVQPEASVEPDELFETTSAEAAKEGEIHDEKKTYAPVAMIVGKGELYPPLEADLLEAAVGEERTVDVTPDVGAGVRDPAQVKMISTRELERANVDHPHVGMQFEYKGKHATITALSGGRVRLDFNNPLAGKTLRYKYTIRENAETSEEKIAALIQLHYGKSEGFEVVKADEDGIEITLAESCKYDQGWFMAKYRVVTDLRQYLETDAIRFVEEYASVTTPAADEEEHDHDHDHDDEAGEDAEKELPPPPPAGDDGEGEAEEPDADEE